MLVIAWLFGLVESFSQLTVKRYCSSRTVPSVYRSGTVSLKQFRPINDT
jgi:hypothetical protein